MTRFAKIPGFLCFGLSFKKEQSTVFQQHGLRLKAGAESHSNSPILGHPSGCIWSWSDEINKTASSAKIKDAVLRSRATHSSHPLLHVKILSMDAILYKTARHTPGSGPQLPKNVWDYRYSSWPWFKGFPIHTSQQNKCIHAFTCRCWISLLLIHDLEIYGGHQCNVFKKMDGPPTIQHWCIYVYGSFSVFLPISKGTGAEATHRGTRRMSHIMQCVCVCVCGGSMLLACVH